MSDAVRFFPSRRPKFGPLLTSTSLLAFSLLTAQASASCDFTGTATVIPPQCDGTQIQYVVTSPQSTLTVTDETSGGIDYRPHASVSASTMTLNVLGQTIIVSANYSGIYAQTAQPERDLVATIGDQVSVTAGVGGFGGIWFDNDFKGDITVTTGATVHTTGTDNTGVTAVTDEGAVHLINSGTVTADNARGLYADGGYNNTTSDPVLVWIENSGNVTSYLAGIRTVNWQGLAKLTNTGTVTAETRQGLVAWSANGDASVTNSGTVTALDDNALVGSAETGDVSIVNSGHLTSQNDAGHIDTGTGHNGIEAAVGASGDVSVTNTVSGVINAAAGAAINVDYDSVAHATGDATIINAGTASGSTGVLVNARTSGTTTITNTGTISGTVYGLDLGAAATINNTGTIRGTTSAIRFGADGNTLNVLPTSIYDGIVDYNGTRDNTTIFGSGSYHLAAANYLDALNSIKLDNSGQTVVLDKASETVGNGGGYINVVELPSVGRSASQYVSSVSDVVGSIIALDVARPDQIAPDGGMSSVLQYGETKPDSEATKAVKTLGEGLAVDGNGNLFWSRVFGGVRYQAEDGADPWNRSTHAGLIGGVDRQVGDYRLGFFGGGGIVRSTTGSSSEVSGETGFFGVYGATEVGAYQLNASLTTGGIANTADRSVNNGTETATGDFNGWYVSPELALSRDYAFGNGWTVTPSIKARYTGAFYQGYDETGSNQNISYDARDTHALDGKLQVEVSRRFERADGLPIRVTATATLADTQYLGDGGIQASLSGNQFSVSSNSDSNVLGGGLGLGFDAQLSSAASVYGGVEGMYYSDESLSVSGRLGIKLAF